VKSLNSNVSTKLGNQTIDKWYKVTANGSEVPSGDVLSYRISRESDWQGAEAQIVLDNTDSTYNTLKRGHILRIDEGLVHNAGVQEFGGFYGIIATIEQEQRAGDTLAISAFDLVSRLAELTVDQHYEPTKTFVEREEPTPNPITGNTNYSDVFDLANESISRTPPPVIYLTEFESQQTIIQSQGYEVDYQNGQIIFGNPINTYIHGIAIDYYYYASEGYYVEDAIRDIIIESDGYGNTPLTEADNLRETFSVIEGKTVDTMTPNLIAETIDGVEYEAGQLWFTSYNNIVTTLASGNFTVPGGATIDDISQRFGRIILDAAIDITSTVTLDIDYVFRTIQATGVQFPVFHATAQLFKNRLAAIKKLCSILAPNYRLFTKAISPEKIWAEYQSQKVTADFALNSNLMTRLVYSPDPIAVTRVVRYGQGINMTNRCYGTDVHMEEVANPGIDTAKWDYQLWSDGTSATPTLADSSVQVDTGYVLASDASVPTNGTFRIVMRLDNPAEVWFGFFNALTGAVPSGLFLHYCDPSLAPTVSGVTKLGELVAYDNDDAVNPKTRFTDYTGSEVEIPYTEEWNGGTIELRLIWDLRREAYGFYRGRQFVGWYFDKEFIGSTANVGIYVPQGTAHVDLIEVSGVDAAGTGVYDHFVNAGYTGYSVNHELVFGGLSSDGRFIFTSGLGNIGDILTDPIPRVTVDGIGLEVEAYQVNNADVTYRKKAHEDAHRHLGITFDWETDRYDYEIFLPHTGLSPKHDIIIYDPGGTEIFTAEAGNSLVDYGRGIVRHRRPLSGGDPHIEPSTATYTVTRSDLFEVDYNNNRFLISANAFTFSYGLVTTSDLSPEQQLQYEVYRAVVGRSTANEWLRSITPAGPTTYTYNGTAPEQTREGWDKPSIVRATFKYREFVEPYDGLGRMTDGDWDTQFQLAFKENPVPGSILAVIDLGADYTIDTIDLMMGYYKMGALDEIQVPYTATLTIETRADAGEFDVVAPEMTGFEVSAGDTKSFERTELKDGQVMRYIRIKIESLEHVAAGDPPGIWPIAIVALAAYSDAVIKGEATLVSTEAEETSTKLYDEDGILSAAGDIADSESNLDDFWGTKTDLNRRCMGILKEHYKNHRKAEIQLPFAPHIQRGVTIELDDAAHGISQSNWFVERETNSNGAKAIALARYP
jgi:hypothetical protein